MDPLWLVILLTLLAGSTIPIGGWIARFEHIQPAWLEEEWRHSVIAFGGGILLAAVALVLIPEGTRHLSVWQVAIWFVLGGLSFFALDRSLASSGGSVGQLLAMLADFVPEAMALGAAFAIEDGGGAGLLLAVLIGLQNLPEGFNAYRELVYGGDDEHETRYLGIFVAMAFLGPLAGLFGYFVLSTSVMATGSVMVFAAAGILYLTFQDIAPQARLDKHWAPSLGAVLGFLFGLMGQMLLPG